MPDQIYNLPFLWTVNFARSVLAGCALILQNRLDVIGRQSDNVGIFA